MQPRHRVSRTAIEMIERFEGYRRAAAQLPDGRWTIGHGHTLTARQGAEVSEDDAEALLLYDLIAITHALNEAVYTPLTQNQFDALASFAFNLGLDNFHRSGVLRRLNEGAILQAACAMELWRKANVGGERIVVDALVRRRSAEKTLFLTPPGGAWVPAPSPILRPLLDTDAQDIVPRQAPVEVATAVEGDQLVVLREGEPAPAPVAPEEDEAEGPSRAAAETVRMRLSSLFQEPGAEPSAADLEDAAVEPPTHPDQIPEEPRPQADFGPPLVVHPVPDRTGAGDPVPFFLRAPEPEAESAEPRVEDEREDGPESHDLFDRPPAYEPLDDEGAESEAGDEMAAASGRDRYVIDDSAPYDFVAPVVQPLPERPEGSVVILAGLAVLGLTFFGGGVFWVIYARPVAGSRVLGPHTVGGLAGIAGVFFFAIAVYLLLDRLGRASERQARRRP